MDEGEVYGPQIKHWWWHRHRVRTHQDDFGWTAILDYRRGIGGSGSTSVSGCDTREEAIESLKHSVTMRVALVDGQWVEV